MIAANHDFGNEDDIDREVEKLGSEMERLLIWKEELEEELCSTDSRLEEIQPRLEELKCSSPTRFAWLTAREALRIVMQENKRLHWRQAHRLIAAGGCDVGAATIKVYLSTDWRFGNDWGTGRYTFLW